MSASVETAPPSKRSIEARRATRLEKARRERLIVDLLNRGVSVAEIAAREGVTEKRMRALVSEILARRMPEAPAEFLALQVGRLNEALLVAYGAMSGGNLRAVDRVVKIVRELDRYHGFVAAGRSCGEARRVEAEGPLALVADRLQLPSDASPRHPRESGDPDRQPLSSPTGWRVAPMSAAVGWTPVFTGVTTLDGPNSHPDGEPGSADRPEMTPQSFEIIESAPGNALVRAASDEAFASPLAPAQVPTAAPLADRLEMLPQNVEKIESAPGNGAAERSSDAVIRCREAPAQNPLAPDAPLMRRIEVQPQALERAQRNYLTAVPPASIVPTVANLSGVRRPNVRATLNGVMAC